MNSEGIIDRQKVVSAIQLGMEKAKINYQELARRIDKSPTYIYKFCTEGKPNELPLSVCLQISKVLDVSLSELTAGLIGSQQDSATVFKGILIFLRENKIPLEKLDMDSLGALFLEIIDRLPQAIRIASATVGKTGRESVSENILKAIAIGLILEERKREIIK